MGYLRKNANWSYIRNIFYQGKNHNNKYVLLETKQYPKTKKTVESIAK